MKQRPDGRWEKSITTDGKKLHFYSTAKTERQAEKDITNQMLEYDAKLHRERHNFKELSEQMLDVNANRNRVFSYKDYLDILRKDT